MNRVTHSISLISIIKLRRILINVWIWKFKILHFPLRIVLTKNFIKWQMHQQWQGIQVTNFIKKLVRKFKSIIFWRFWRKSLKLIPKFRKYSTRIKELEMFTCRLLWNSLNDNVLLQFIVKAYYEINWHKAIIGHHRTILANSFFNIIEVFP